MSLSFFGLPIYPFVGGRDYGSVRVGIFWVGAGYPSFCFKGARQSASCASTELESRSDRLCVYQ